MSSRVWQSCVIDAPIGKVWAILRPLDFVYLPSVSSIELDSKSTEDTIGATRRIFYRALPGTQVPEQQIRLLELSDSRYEVSWELISSNQNLSFSSVNHTIRLRRVTESNKTFAEMTSDFSRDATSAAIEEARLKQMEHLNGLTNEAIKKFTFKSTTEDIISGRNLKGKVALVTGVSSGLGLETCRALAKAGCHVIGTVREAKKGEEAFKSTIHSTVPGASVEIMSLDLTSFKSIHSFAAEFLKKHQKLHYLILNAGVMMIKDRTLTTEGIESQFGVNHVGHFLLTNLLLKTIQASAPSRVVVLSSAGHMRSGIKFDDWNSEKNYDSMLAYGQSKTANALFALHLNSKMKAEGVKVEAFSVHPGSIHTELQRHLTEREITGLMALHYRFKTVQQGAATTLVAALDESLEGKGGAYLSDCNPAPTAPWASNAEFASQLWKLTEEIIAKHSK